MSTLQVVLLLVLVVLIAIALNAFFRPQRKQHDAGSSSGYQIFGPGVRDDDRYWLAGGFFYSNPDDPALFVLNLWGIGMTPNLAHPLGVRLTIAFLVMLLLVPVLLALFVPGFGSSSGCHSFSGCKLTP